MMKPNWFDTQYADAMEKMGAEQALAEIAKSPRVVQAVKDALAEHDKHAGKGGWAGPSRTQAIRSALAEAISAD